MGGWNWINVNVFRTNVPDFCSHIRFRLEIHFTIARVCMWCDRNCCWRLMNPDFPFSPQQIRNGMSKSVEIWEQPNLVKPNVSSEWFFSFSFLSSVQTFVLLLMLLDKLIIRFAFVGETRIVRSMQCVHFKVCCLLVCFLFFILNFVPRHFLHICARQSAPDYAQINWMVTSSRLPSSILVAHDDSVFAWLCTSFVYFCIVFFLFWSHMYVYM